MLAAGLSSHPEMSVPPKRWPAWNSSDTERMTRGSGFAPAWAAAARRGRAPWSWRGEQKPSRSFSHGRTSGTEISASHPSAPKAAFQLRKP